MFCRLFAASRSRNEPMLRTPARVSRRYQGGSDCRSVLVQEMSEVGKGESHTRLDEIDNV